MLSSDNISSIPLVVVHGGATRRQGALVWYENEAACIGNIGRIMMKCLNGVDSKYIALWAALAILFGTLSSVPAQAQDKPNIVVIMGDDPGLMQTICLRK